MSLIDPNLFKGEPEAGGGSPFASAYSSPRRTGAGFVDPRTMTRVVQWALYAEVALYAFVLLGHILDAAGVTQFTSPFSGGDMTSQQMGFGAVGMLVILAAIVRGVLCLHWMWRANKNAHSLASMIETTPGWAWGAFFVPIWNLFKPFQAMSEIWRSAENPVSWRGIATPAILWVWWALWLGIGVFSRLVETAAESAGAPITGTIMTLVASAALNLVFAYMIGHVAKRQVEAKNDTVFD